MNKTEEHFLSKEGRSTRSNNSFLVDVGVVLSEIDTLSRNDATVLFDKTTIPNSGIQFYGYLEFKNFIVSIYLISMKVIGNPLLNS